MLLFYHNRNAITELQQTWCNRMMVADNNQASSPIISRQLSRYQPFLLDKILEVSWGNDLPFGPLLWACCIFSFLSQPVQVTEAQVRDDQWAMPYQLEELNKCNFSRFGILQRSQPTSQYPYAPSWRLFSWENWFFFFICGFIGFCGEYFQLLITPVHYQPFNFGHSILCLPP